MNLRKRVANAEKWVVPLDEDGPITVVELVSGKKDLEHRRQLGPARVREAVMRMREAIQRSANAEPNADVLEGDDRSDLARFNESSGNRDFALEFDVPENFADIRE